MTALLVEKWNVSSARPRTVPLNSPGRNDLEELNEAFTLWLNDDYHHKLHSGIEERPIDRYNASVGRVLIRRLSGRTR